MSNTRWECRTLNTCILQFIISIKMEVHLRDFRDKILKNMHRDRNQFVLKPPHFALSFHCFVVNPKLTDMVSLILWVIILWLNCHSLLWTLPVKRNMPIIVACSMICLESIIFSVIELDYCRKYRPIYKLS